MKNEIAMIMTILYLATGKQYTAGEVEARFSEFRERSSKCEERGRDSRIAAPLSITSLDGYAFPRRGDEQALLRGYGAFCFLRRSYLAVRFGLITISML